MSAPRREHRCAGCGATFVAFRRALPCPVCGRTAGESAPILDTILRAYDENVRAHGAPVPPSFEVRDAWDDYLYRGLFFLRAYDSRGPRDTAETVIARMLADSTTASDEGWRAHFAEFYRELLRARRRASEREK